MEGRTVSGPTGARACILCHDQTQLSHCEALRTGRLLLRASLRKGYTSSQVSRCQGKREVIPRRR